MQMTLTAACEDIAAYDLKKLTDDRTILRRKTGADFITRGEAKRLLLDRDDCAALTLYAEMRRAGQPVKFAGVFASRVRDAMRDYPGEDQHTVVLLGNGSTFCLPSSMLDLSTGLNSGSYVVTATLVDVRNLRQRVQRASELERERSDAVA